MPRKLLTILLTTQWLFSQDSAIVFNEVHYHPASDNSSLEFIELHNQLAVETDLSNWRLDGDVRFNFPEGTTIPARGYLVIAKDPEALRAVTGSPRALGPFEGFLANSGNTLRLYNNNRSFRVSESPPPTVAAETLWNVDLQGNGNGGAFGQLAPPLNMSGSASGLGGTWNHLSLGGHPTTSTNPSFPLVKSDGSPSSVTFAINGNVSGWSQAGDALHADYLFVNAGNSDSAVTWQISGLDADENYSLILYGGVGRDIRITIDTNGNGSLADENPLFAPANGSVMVEQITPSPGANPLILGRAEGGNNGEGNWGGFQLLIPGEQGGEQGQPTLGGVPSDSLEKRRIMDELKYSDTAPWPVGPDGSGVTLAKVDPMAGTAEPSHWSFSRTLNGTPGAPNTIAPPSSFRINEASGSLDPAFQVELYNAGSSPIDHTNFVLASSDPLHADFRFPAGSLAPGGFLSIDAATLGFIPADNERLFLFPPDKSSLLGALRIDDRPLARFPDGNEEWWRPDFLTPGAPNQVTLEDGLVINEIFYHAYPDRRVPSPPASVTSTVVHFNSNWRYNLDAGPAGLPSDWATISHAVDGLSWAEGPGLLGKESALLGEPIATELTLSPKTTYYFETEFTYSGAAAVNEMTLNHYFDDGAVIYLNGIEIARVGMPGGSITPTTPATPGVGNASLASLTLTNPDIQEGSNRLSVEVHQANPGSNDVVMGLEVILEYPDESPGNAQPAYAEREEEWLELFNQSNEPIDLDRWKIRGGISYDFPAITLNAGDYLVVAREAEALSRKYPASTIIGNYSGRMSNRSETIRLIDPRGNPADEVRYYDSGNWHVEADGNGSSLELIDSRADNSVAGSWAPSEASGSWQTYSYTATAIDDGIGNNVYHEFLIALLDQGEFLLDDVSVVENGSLEFIQNGDFESDLVGRPANKWRALGTHGSHGKTVVVTDPDDPGNQCLHVVATGPTEDKHNKLETTFANGERVVAGRDYTITFRAKWLSGSNQVNTRLYFNYLQKTTLLDVPEVWGTPGTVNTTFTPNAGPSLSALSHSPVVPNPGQAVTISIKANDRDGIDDLTLFYSVDGGGVGNVPMTPGPNGIYTGSIPGQSSGRVVRFFVRGRDTSAAASFFPAQGPKGGAFYQVQDNFADNSGQRHNLRIIMSDTDRSFLFLNTNRMSNDRFPATVIEDEERIYYNVGLRLKASAFGRFQRDHYGFNLEFQPDQLFRGVHQTISIERSPNLKELLAKMLMNRAGGGFWSFYDDVAHIITPTPSDRGPGLLSMSRHTSTFFDGLFPDSDRDGTLFNQELLYNPNGTTGGAEGLKIGNPYNHNNGRYDLEDRGTDKEPYRWGFQIRSARGRNDYSQIIALNQALDLNGPALKNALDELIDVDQWMRTFAMMSLNGTDDIYSRIWEHNFRYFVRPTDQKIIVLQWDLDRSFNLGVSSAITPTRNNVVKLFSIPQYRRLFDGHLEDLAATTFNSIYTSPLASHLSAVTGDNMSPESLYVSSRANQALQSIPAPIPFEITTNGGDDFSEAGSAVTLSGQGWIDVFTIEVNDLPHRVTWTDGDSWEITVPIAPGPNTLDLAARNNQGLLVGNDRITVTNTSAIELANATNVTLSEVHYHPSDPTAAETAAGFADAELFEFIEITNISDGEVDLGGSAFTSGVSLTFPPGTLLAPRDRILIVSNRKAFQFRYPAFSQVIVDEYRGQLSNGGERIVYQAADGSLIADLSYRDESPWPEGADGEGYSLVFAGGDLASPLNWRTSIHPGGNPGTDDSQPFTGDSDQLLSYALAGDPVAVIRSGSLEISFLQNLSADDAVVTAEYSPDLSNWMPLTTAELVSRRNQGNGTTLVTYRTPPSPNSEEHQFARVKLIIR